MSETPTPPKKKKSKLKKLLVLILGFAAVGGGGAGAVLYASGGVLPGGHAEGEEDENLPHLVPREGADEGAVAAATAAARRGRVDPRLFQATYHPLEGNFTSNLRGGQAFAQIGLGFSTYYDERVIANIERHEMAIRSAILMTLSEQDPSQIASLQGKEALKNALRDAVNGVLTNREGFGGIDEVYFTSFVTQ